MAAVNAQTFTSSRPAAVGIGRPSLPCTSSSAQAGPYLPSSSPRNSLRSNSQGLRRKRQTTKKVSKAPIVSALRGDGSSKEGSGRVFKSMQNAAERRKESDAEAAALASFDDVDIARAIADFETAESSSGSRGGKMVQTPRFATLRAFGEAGGEGVVTGEFEGTSVFELIAANIEASKQVKNWEVLSGRLAMLAISVALGVEFYTGNSVFRGIDLQKLEAVAALCAVATVSAAGFAYAWRAKADVVSLMSKGYKNMVESALDNLIDGLFFDE